jgi:tRNA 2-thiouridine synthesizing protein C
MSSVAIINQSAPYGSSNANESLDTAMIAGTFGQDVSLYFIGDGVFQLKKNQNPETKGIKNLSKTMKSLVFFDVEKLYVCQQSLKERGLSTDDLCVNVVSLSQPSISEHLSSHDNIMVF